MSVGLVAVVVLRLGYKRVNEKREMEGNESGLSVQEMSELGDKSPSFRYMI